MILFWHNFKIKFIKKMLEFCQKFVSILPKWLNRVLTRSNQTIYNPSHTCLTEHMHSLKFRPKCIPLLLLVSWQLQLALALFILLVILPASVNFLFLYMSSSPTTALWPTKGSKKSYSYVIPKIVENRMDSMMSSASAAASIPAPEMPLSSELVRQANAARMRECSTDADAKTRYTFLQCKLHKPIKNFNRITKGLYTIITHL
jgi:hypothetical protein